MILALVLITLLAVVTTLLVVSVRRNLQFADKLDELETQIEESLDILDDCYSRISRVAETPVAFDDPIVKQLLSDIKQTKDAVLLVANKIVEFDKESEIDADTSEQAPDR